MRLPKMILFDYGHTLLHEPGFDFRKGIRALFPYVTKNPRGITPEEFDAFGKKLYDEVFGKTRDQNVEVHECQFLRLELEYHGMELSIPVEEAEEVLWDNISPGEKMPHIEEVLAWLRQKNIRSGVISNLCWSGRALSRRIARLLPDNQFEFILASSEYIFRKPSHYIFELALQKAGLPPEEVWFCGDNLEADILGAKNAGMFPVWYHVEKKVPEQALDFPHLEIQDWREFLNMMEF